jgi:UrcA family protein
MSNLLRASIPSLLRASAAVVIAIGLQTVAAAADLDQTGPSVKVSFSDLNLATPQGTAALYRRFHSAAEIVCNRFSGISVAQKQRWHTCINAAIDSAAVKVRDANFSAYIAATQRPASAVRILSSASTAVSTTK